MTITRRTCRDCLDDDEEDDAQELDRLSSSTHPHDQQRDVHSVSPRPRPLLLRLGVLLPAVAAIVAFLLSCQATTCQAFALNDARSSAGRLLLLDREPRQSRLRRSNANPTIRTQQVMYMSSSTSADDVYVMVNGMPGPMATAAAEACLRKGLRLAPTAMTGPDIPPQILTVTDAVTSTSAQVRLVPATMDNKEELVASIAAMRQAAGGDTHLLVIDFTHPSAVNDNARFYVEQRLPFVMGTTGGDRQRLATDVQNGNLPCVISPNMGKQIVAMQAALEDLATKYPGAFAGYQLTVTESHQVTKADTSGTALSVISSINKLLSPNDQFSPSQVQLIRDEQSAIEFGVPPSALKGHAFHTYQLTSPDGSVTFQLQHNVAGRTIYAEGTADAVKFLAKKVREGIDVPQIYTMMNVLEEGALE